LVYQGLVGAFDIEGMDLNNDGIPDLVVSTLFEPGLHWFEAPTQSGGTWAHHLIDHDFEATDLYRGDIDQQGGEDIAAAGYAMGLGQLPNSLAWFSREQDLSGSITFTKHYIDYNSPRSPGDISLDDLDGDGDLDLITTSYLNGEMLWYENRLAD
jgi:hypothetical protein